MRCELLDDPIGRVEKSWERQREASLVHLCSVAGEAWKTLMMSDRTLTMEPFQGGVGCLEVAFDSLFQCV